MNEKQRLIEVEGAELDAIKAAGLGAPHVFSNRVGSRINFWANADELRAWRASQTTSDGDQR